VDGPGRPGGRIDPDRIEYRRLRLSIMVIVELKAQPGRRNELKSVFESMLAKHASGLQGFLGSSRYEKLDDPDMLVEIAEWESAEARDAHMQAAAAAGRTHRWSSSSRNRSESPS
jgi:quinol monooxygenase YgiN